MTFYPWIYPPFMSPVSGRINIQNVQSLTSDYVWLGNSSDFAQPSPAIIDLRLDLIDLRNLLATTSFVIQHPVQGLDGSQALNQIDNGMISNLDGLIVPTSLTHDKFWIGDENDRPIEIDTLPIGGLPDLTYKNLWRGDATNRPVEIQFLPLENFGNLTSQNIWRGNGSNRPVESDSLTSLETSVSLLSARVSVVEGDLFTLEFFTIPAINARITSVQTALGILGATVIGMGFAITALQAQVSSIEAAIAVLNSQVSSLQTQVNNLNTRLTTAENNIISINARIDNLRLNTILADGDVSFYNFRLINLADPIGDLDGVNLRTMEGAISGAIDDITLDGFVLGDSDDTGLVHTTRGPDCVLNVIPAEDDVSFSNYAITDLETLEFTTWDEMEAKAQNGINFLFLWKLFNGGVR